MVELLFLDSSTISLIIRLDIECLEGTDGFAFLDSHIRKKKQQKQKDYKWPELHFISLPKSSNISSEKAKTRLLKAMSNQSCSYLHDNWN